MSFFADLANTLGAQLGDNLLDRTGQFINQIAPLFQAGFGIYVLMVILSYYGQSGTVSLIDFAKRSAGWIVLIALAFSPSVYSKLAHTIYGLPDEISALFTNGAKFDVAAIDHSYTELENAIIRIGELHSKYSWMQIGNHLALVEIRIVISLCGMLLIGVAFAYYTFAKISLALVLMLGAFFIGCLIFPATRQYGINWIGQCLNHIITCTMFVLLTVVQMEVFQGLVNQISNGDWTNHIFLEALIPVFILDTIVFLVIAWGIRSLGINRRGCRTGICTFAGDGWRGNRQGRGSGTVFYAPGGSTPSFGRRFDCQRCPCFVERRRFVLTNYA